MEYTFEILNLSHARFPTFFFIEFKDQEENKHRQVIWTIQRTQSQVMFSDKKREGVPDFIHTKTMIIMVGKFLNEVSYEERLEMMGSQNELVRPGILSVNLFGDFEVIIDNGNQRIYLDIVKELETE